jgi:glycolate oxidase iron-sulfur subunit
MFPVGAKLMGMLQRASFIGKPYSPARLALPLMGMKIDKQIPYFALKPFLERVPEVNPVEKRKCRVAYFVGCAGNLIFPEIGESVVGLLNHYGVEVVIPKTQMCCGTPIFNSGDFTGAAYFARRNLRAFEDLGVDAIITACGSCGLSWRQEWSEQLGVEVPESISSKVYDIAEFLTDCLGIDVVDAVSERNLRLTYHDPCHLARGMHVTTQPRKLLSSLPGVELVEMNESDKCCGGGGAFSIYHPDLSRAVGKHTAESIAKSGADVIVTGCPSCIMQLDEMLYLAKSPRPVTHTACMLWEGVRERC